MTPSGPVKQPFGTARWSVRSSRYCIGAALARIELKTVFAQLIPRFPSMHLAVDPETLEVRGDVLMC